MFTILFGESTELLRYQITSWSDLFTITIVSCCKRLVVRCLVIIEVLEQIYQGICVRFCQKHAGIMGLKMNVKVLKGRRELEDL